MARSVEEWIGKNDDAIPPPRVRLRIFDKHGGRCYLCTAKILPGSYWQSDHIRALINGGENRESNLAPACRNCCYSKTADDLAEKSEVARKRSKHLGIKKRKGRPMAGSRDSQFKRRMDGTVVRRK